MQAPQASSGAPNGYNPLLDDSDREAAASRAERTAHGQDQPSHDLDGSESNHSNIFSLAAAHERAAAAHGASDGSLSSAVDQQHQHQLHKNATTSQQPTPAPQHDSPGQQRTQDPFEAHTGAHMHSRDRGGELAREGEESSRTAEEASISHMASRDGRAHAPEAQTHDASAGRRSGLGDLDSGDALRPGSSHASHLHGSGTHAPAANGCTASLSSDVRSDVDHCNGLGWAGDSAGGLNGTGNMRHASSMEQLAQLADDYEGRNSVQGSTSRAGGDARLDLRSGLFLCFLAASESRTRSVASMYCTGAKSCRTVIMIAVPRCPTGSPSVPNNCLQLQYLASVRHVHCCALCATLS